MELQISEEPFGGVGYTSLVRWDLGANSRWERLRWSYFDWDECVLVMFLAMFGLGDL
jgi:hypothetical protein